jgi:hypothetical protein
LDFFLDLAQAAIAFEGKKALRTIYRPEPFQRALICEDRSLGTEDLSGQRNGLKVKNIHTSYISKHKPVKDI